jgi:hypothetical protein
MGSSTSTDSSSDSTDSSCQSWKIGFGITMGGSVCCCLSCICLLILLIMSYTAL